MIAPDGQPFCLGPGPRVPSPRLAGIALVLDFLAGNIQYLLYSVVIGVLAALVKQFHSAIAEWILSRVFITAKIYSGDIAYNWLIEWYSKKGGFDKLRVFEVRGGQCRPSGPNAFFGAHNDSDNELKPASDKKLRYLPDATVTMSEWYKGRWMTITFDVSQSNPWSQSVITIRMLTMDRSLVDSLLLEAKKAHEASSNEIAIHTHDHTFCGRPEWILIGFQPKRPLDSIILDANAKEVILADAQDFLKSKQWYAARGIPFRRGYLLYGVPGSGKTSLVHGLAGHLGLDIFVLTLSNAGLDDANLKTLICGLPERCIVLIEDIDVAFARKDARKLPKSGSGSKKGKGREDKAAEDAVEKPSSEDKHEAEGFSRITLSGLLNALDGISAQEGRLLFATTNCHDALDPALTRPGRMDIRIRFENASRTQARALFEHFYMPDSLEKSEAEGVHAGGSVSAEKTCSDDSDLIDLSDDTPLQSPDFLPAELVSGDLHAFSGIEAGWSAETVRRLAQEFAEAVPERMVSMAALQGFLMGYKTRPRAAVGEVGRWLEEMEEEKEEQEEDCVNDETDEEVKTEDGEVAEGSAREVEEWSNQVAASEDIRAQDGASTSSNSSRSVDVLSEADVDVLMAHEFGRR